MKSRPVVTGILLVLTCSTGLSQSLTLGVGGGTAIVQNTDGKSYTRDISQGGLGLGLSYSFGAMANLSFPKSPFSLVGRISYVSMSGSGFVSTPGIYITGTGTVETNVHLLSVGLGTEWTMLRGPVAPYLGANLLLSSFGKTSYKFINLAGTTEYLTGGGALGGIGFEVGAQLSLLPTLRLDVTGNYNFNSLLGTIQMSDFRTLGITADFLFTIY